MKCEAFQFLGRKLKNVRNQDAYASGILYNFRSLDKIMGRSKQSNSDIQQKNWLVRGSISITNALSKNSKKNHQSA